MGIFSTLFGQRRGSHDTTHWSEEAHYEAKSRLFAEHFGEPSESVLAALVGFPVGGPVDLWVFPSEEGTTLTTMQLVALGKTEQRRSKIGKYELCTSIPARLGVDGGIEDEESPWLKQAMRARSMLTAIAYFSFQTRLNPFETAEFPGDDDQADMCIVFDDAIGNATLAGDKIGVLRCTEVLPEEMAHARQFGGQALINRLRENGVYPFGGTDRNSIL